MCYLQTPLTWWIVSLTHTQLRGHLAPRGWRMCRCKPSPDCRVVSVTRPDEGERGPGGAGKAALYAALLLGPARSHAEETGPSVEGVVPLTSEGACHHRHLRARLLLVLGKPVMGG